MSAYFDQNKKSYITKEGYDTRDVDDLGFYGEDDDFLYDDDVMYYDDDDILIADEDYITDDYQKWKLSYSEDLIDVDPNEYDYFFYKMIENYIQFKRSDLNLD